VRPRPRSGDRGAVLVEAVLLMPVLILVVFGIIEWSSAYHDSSVTADAARAGGRIASVESLDPNYATDAAASVGEVLQSLPSNEPQQMWVYKANASGYPGNETSFASCTTNCIKYVWQPASKTFDTAAPQGSGWPAASQQVCTEPFDSVGIWVQVQHDFITNMFGASVMESDHSVYRLEPTSLAAC
jgi:hypothetical protein